MALGEDALALEGGGHRSFQSLGQSYQIGSRASRPQSQIEQRTLRRRQHGAGLVERRGWHGWHCFRLLIVRLQIDIMPKNVVLGRHLHKHRPGRRGARDPARPPDGPVQILAPLDQKLRLGHRPRDGHLVYGVQLIRLAGIAPDAAGQHQHGNAIQVSFRDSREGVRQPRPWNHVGHRQLPG